MTSTKKQKRLCLFIDGTWNVTKSNTNVWRLFSLCARGETSNVTQVSYYIRGLGTTFGSKLSGGAWGSGINDLITDSYEWLIPRYNPGDEIFIFGFSRGAYAARSLAGLIAKNGIISPGSPIGVGELYGRYRDEKAETIYQLRIDESNGESKNQSVLDRWLLKHSRPADINMIGVWDTVGALWGDYSFLETGLRLPIKNAYHALAIDEHRKTFSPTIYTQNIHLDLPEEKRPKIRNIENVEQRWFVGAHANVGGGYNSDLLAQIPLTWIMSKAIAHGMKFASNLDHSDESCCGNITDSYKEMSYGLYYGLTFGRRHYRSIGTSPVTSGTLKTINLNETIDRSVFDRARLTESYRPKNLTDWARRQGVDITTIVGSVRADDPEVHVY
ncbi:DUF2235 domain-containing protein [Methylocystis rosea]|uniref:DUF2235 domain-containing protein n=1 Tax=Methylocystis rosea TaxID=173366 RepID=UPI0018DCD9C7|nr:DUF2235 domain-containing protein [Methylocystis rosea]